MIKIVGKDKKLFMRRFVFGSESNSHNKGNNNQSTCNQEQGISNLGTIDYMVKLFSSHCENRSNAIARIASNIPNARDLVNASWFKLINPGPIKIKANHAAAKLLLIPESTLKNDFFTALTLAKIGSGYNNKFKVIGDN